MISAFLSYRYESKANDAASIVLLKNSLEVLVSWIKEGRRELGAPGRVAIR